MWSSSESTYAVQSLGWGKGGVTVWEAWDLLDAGGLD
jgi:hypothetical protein